MASEKQVSFINKLLSEKAVQYFELQALYHAATGKTSRLSDSIEELTTQQASWVIDYLLSAPKKLSQAQIAARQSAFNEGSSKYEQLLALAKSHGLKVRKMMKKASIIAEFSKAGIPVPQELL
jgi:hypothetical protein